MNGNYGHIDRKTARRRTKRRNTNAMRMVIMILIALVLILAVGLMIFLLADKKTDKKETLPSFETSEAKSTEHEEETSEATTGEPTETETEEEYTELITKARLKFSMYDYDGAIKLVKETVPDYTKSKVLKAFLAECSQAKSKLLKWKDNKSIVHIFFHSLVVDEELAFSSYKKDDYNQVMTTVDEFMEVINEMYEKGYVLVHLSDICAMTRLEDGTYAMKMQEIYLPEGKIPFVLSVDDVCYYDYMEGTGFANRLIVSESGNVINEMDLPDGTTVRGSYDVVPLLDDFVREHPDFSYKGAKGTLALTGYNGILGYRTSYITYGPGDTTWPSAHTYDNPNIEADREKAKVVADALKATGWKFASHTWGHMNMTNQKTEEGATERFYRDTDWWEAEVKPLIGDCDILIFAYGADIGSWRGYTDDNVLFMYLKEKGFNYFCNVDSSTHAWVQYSSTAGGTGYFRQGRRNVDGQMLYKAVMYPEKDIFDDLFDSYKVFDTDYRSLPVLGVTLPEGNDGKTIMSYEDWIKAKNAAKE